MRKRLLSALLCVMMVLTLLPMASFADNAARVWIWGVELTGENLYYHNGENGAVGTANNTAADYNAYYDTETGTLTLNGLNVTESTATKQISAENDTPPFTYAIFADGDLTINVTAASTVSTGTAAAGNANVALGVKGDVTFKGSAKLAATAGSAAGSVEAESIGVYAIGDLSISSGILEGTGGAATANYAMSAGVSANNIQVTGGTVNGNAETATGGNDGGENPHFGNSLGIYANMLTVSGGSVSGVGSGATGYKSDSDGIAVNEITASAGSISGIAGDTEAVDECHSTGIYAYVNLTVSDNASLTGEGGEATGHYAESYGVFANTTLSISGGKIIATGDKAMGDRYIYSHGIGVYGELTVSGGSVTATGGEAAVSGEAAVDVDVDSYGIYAQADTIAFSGGEVIATGGSAVEESYGILNDGVYDSDSDTYIGGAITVSGIATVTATGGTVSGEDGNSYGIGVSTADISGGTVTAESGAASEDNADSYGLWCQGNSDTPALKMTDGALTVTGGVAEDDSYGIYADDGNVDVSGGTVTVTGGEAGYRSFGIRADGESSIIRVSGGEFTAKTNDTLGGHYALNKALTRGPGVTAQGSTSSDGSSPVNYLDDDNDTYLWVYVPNTPALVVEPSTSGVYTGAAVTLTATPVNIEEPTYQWHSSAAGDTEGAQAIEDATSATYTPPTGTVGTMYYYCVANGVTTSNIVSLTVTVRPARDDTDYYRLAFETNGGSSVSAITRAEGRTVDLTAFSSTREGYVFEGWYTDEELTDRITELRLIKNTTVFAGWSAKEQPPAVFENPFSDVTENDWFYDDVAFVFAEGLMQGTGETTFNPHGNTSRGMIVAILYRLAGQPEVAADCPFEDVKAGSYYEKAITWAASNGVAGGYGGGLFGPDDVITREQMAAILYRYASLKGYDVSGQADLSAFADYDTISDYAVKPMAWAGFEELVNGVGGNLIDSAGAATRAQVSAILHRFCLNVAK